MIRHRPFELAALVATGLVVLLAVLWARTGAPVGVYIDDGFYAILGRALATGHGLRYLGWPDTPAPAHYPPGYPILLALLWRAGGSLAAVARWGVWLNAVCAGLVAAAVATALVVRFQVHPWLAAAAAVLAAVATPVLAVTTLLLSEAPFLLLLVAVLWAADRSGADPPGLRWALVAGVLAGLATLVRAVGLTALIAVVGVALLQRRWRPAAAALLGGLVVLGPWLAWNAARRHPGFGPLEASYGSYAGFYVDAVRSEGVGFALTVVKRNVIAIVEVFAALFAPLGREWARWVGAGGVTVALLLALRPVWRKLPVLGAFLVLYLAVIICWPYDPSRFLWAIWPLLIGVLTVGAAAALALVRGGGWRRPLGAGLTALLTLAVIGYARTSVRGLLVRGWEPSQTVSGARALAIVTWVTAHTRPEDVIATRFDPLVYLYSGRRAVPVAMVRATDYVAPPEGSAAATDLRAILMFYHPTYLVLPGVAADLAPSVAALLRSGSVEVSPAADLAGGQAVLALRWPGTT